MSPFDQNFPEPLQSIVNHAERFSVALALAETDQSRDVATGPAELSLSETWLVGRAGEVEAVVGDIVGDWRSCGLSSRSASAAIECYLIGLHRSMARDASFGEPTCCSVSQESMTVDFFAAPRDQRGASYPKMLPVMPPPLAHLPCGLVQSQVAADARR